MTILKVKEHNHLFRDTNSGALINRDANSLQEYLSKRQLFINQKEELNKVKSEMESIKNDMCEIKELMYKLIDTKHG